MKTLKPKRYALVPGKVISKNDGDEHYINAPKLAYLYGIDFEACIVIGINDPYTPEQAERDGLTVLYPDFTGEYKVPENKQPRAWFNNFKESEHERFLGVVPA